MQNSNTGPFRTAEPTRMVEMVFPDQTNHYDTLFGGHALRMMDKAAFVAATRYCRKECVTARSEGIDFKHPVKHGQMVELIARVKSTGRTSMVVEVELWAEDLLSGARSLCTVGSFVMVALDAWKKPTPIEPLPDAQ